MTSVVPIILAAGDSARMGFPKALLPVGQDTFLTRILDTLDQAGLSDPRVVLGAHASLIRPTLANYAASILVNPNPARGQGSSVRLGVQGLDPDCPGCLIWPVDQPLISPDLVRGLAGLFAISMKPLVLPRCQDKPGHPAIFGRSLIEELLAAPADASPKLVVARHRRRAAWLQTDETGVIEDIDTPKDYFRIIGESLESALARRHATNLQ